MSEKYTKMMSATLIKYRDEVYNKWNLDRNVVTHNYICMFKPHLTFNINGLKRTIDAKLEQVASVKLFVKVCMVVVWHVLSK